MKDMEFKRVEHCGGFKNCHESVRECTDDDPECQECIADVADEFQQMDQAFKEQQREERNG